MEWEYKVFTVDHFLSSQENLSIEGVLNKYGKEGWELVGILQNSYKILRKPFKIR